MESVVLERKFYLNSMGCAASVHPEGSDIVDAALQQVEQQKLNLCRVRTKGPRKLIEGDWAGKCQ